MWFCWPARCNLPKLYDPDHVLICTNRGGNKKLTCQIYHLWGFVSICHSFVTAFFNASLLDNDVTKWNTIWSYISFLVSVMWTLCAIKCAGSKINYYNLKTKNQQTKWKPHLASRWLPGLAQHPISCVAVWDSSNQPERENGKGNTLKRKCWRSQGFLGHEVSLPANRKNRGERLNWHSSVCTWNTLKWLSDPHLEKQKGRKPMLK